MDKELASQIKGIGKNITTEELKNDVLAIIPSQSVICPVNKAEATQYFVKKYGAIIVDIPELSADNDERIAQLALAVGRRLERFERASKANAGRDADSRKQIAQNAIKKRWSAK